jgi:sugar/nucleoside kinase (ribokinase family)
MTSSKNLRVLGVGAPIVDILVNVDEDFIKTAGGAKGGMELVNPEALNSILSHVKQQPVKAPGGSAGNTIIGLAELGVKVSFLGKVGKDADGDYYKKRLAELGGDTGNFYSSDTLPTGRCLCLVTPDSERTMRTDLGASVSLSPDEITEKNFEGVALVHVEGYLLFAEPLARRVMELAKAAGCKISLDAGSFEVVKIKKDLFKEILPKYVDVLSFNEDEAREFCGEGSPEKHLEALAALCPTVCLKLGKNGSLIKSRQETVKVEADLVKAVDTTGAGDLWQSGFLFGYLRGFGMKTCGKFGSIVSSEVVRVMGASIPFDRWCEIRKKVKAAST